MRKPLLAAALCLSLAACNALDRSTLAQVQRLDPMTANPAQFAARLDLPTGLAVPPGGVRLMVAAKRSDTGEALRGEYALDEADGIWRLSAADAADLRGVQAVARRWEAEAPDANSGSLTLSIAGCQTGDGPAPTATVSAGLSLDGGAEFLPLVTGLPVARVLSAAQRTGAPDTDLCR